MFRSNTRAGGVLAIASTLAVLISGGNVARAGSFRDSLMPLAKEILQVVVEDQMQTSIQIGEFSGNGHPNCGPGLSEDLKLALNALHKEKNKEHYSGPLCQDHAALKLEGTYKQVRDPKAAEQTILQVEITIRDANGRSKSEKSIEVHDNSLLAAAMGATVHLPAMANHDDRNNAVKKAIEQPSYYAQNTIIRTQPDRPFGVEVLVTSVQDAPRDIAGWNRISARAPVNQKGEPFVQIDQNEVYALRIHNSHRLETAVGMTIDGVDVFTFSEIRDSRGLPKFKNFIIPPGSGIIPGWHKTNHRADSFLVTQYGKGASSKIGLPAKGNVGVITVRFALAWAGNDKPPEEAGARDGGNETGFGQPIDVVQKEVQRRIGVVRDVISIRYSR